MVIGLIQKDKVVEETDLLRRPNMPDRTRVVPVAGAGMKNIPKDGVEFRREIPRDLLMEIEEVVGEITSNYDSLKNEFEQGLINASSIITERDSYVTDPNYATGKGFYTDADSIADMLQIPAFSSQLTLLAKLVLLSKE